LWVGSWGDVFLCPAEIRSVLRENGGLHAGRRRKCSMVLRSRVRGVEISLPRGGMIDASEKTRKPKASPTLKAGDAYDSCHRFATKFRRRPSQSKKKRASLLVQGMRLQDRQQILRIARTCGRGRTRGKSPRQSGRRLLLEGACIERVSVHDLRKVGD